MKKVIDTRFVNGGFETPVGIITVVADVGEELQEYLKVHDCKI